MAFFFLLFLSLLHAVDAQFSYSFPDCTSDPLKSIPSICDTTKDPATRATALISLFTPQELIANTVNLSPGVPRLGVPSYQWWSEALHGVAGSPGVSFASPGNNFSFATSFPEPILISAAFDDPLVKSIAQVISTEARAFNNFHRAGLDFFTPNINPFKDPRWGRGQETPGEDPFRIAQYVLNLIDGLQGGIDPTPLKIVADCKHYAAYDLDHWMGIDRTSFNAIVTTQDLSEYYLPPFQSCVRDAKVASVMCSYNEVNGVPSCANSYLLQSILRDSWAFDDTRWVTSDCDAVDNIFSTHHFTQTYPQAVADALKAGTDIDCGTAYSTHLPDALNQSLITVSDLQRALTRQYSALVRLGYFDPPQSQPFRQLSWSDVNTPSAQSLAYTAAAEAIVLLKNTNATLPFSSTIKNVAVIGPWANATTQMQGNYQGVAPFLISPLQAAMNVGFHNVTFAQGTQIDSTSTSGFAAAVAAAQSADIVVYAGGIDDSVESEGHDRTDIAWPGNQLDLLSSLVGTGKPVVVVQFGGGQVDDSALLSEPGVHALLWAGYPGQSGGQAVLDVLTGKVAPAGRLPVTQYPAAYVNQVNMTDMRLRPASDGSNPGRTYKWYTGTPVFEFGFGMHYTTFALSFQGTQPVASYSISKLVSSSGGGFTDLLPLDTFHVLVHNTGHMHASSFSLLFFVSPSSSTGPAPQPLRQLVGYTRVHNVTAGASASASVQVTLGAIARADEEGNMWVYSGEYTLTAPGDGGEISQGLTHTFTLQGNSVMISSFPQNTNATTTTSGR